MTHPWLPMEHMRYVGRGDPCCHDAKTVIPKSLLHIIGQYYVSVIHLLVWHCKHDEHCFWSMPMHGHCEYTISYNHNYYTAFQIRPMSCTQWRWNFVQLLRAFNFCSTSLRGFLLILEPITTALPYTTIPNPMPAMMETRFGRWWQIANHCRIPRGGKNLWHFKYSIFCDNREQ